VQKKDNDIVHLIRQYPDWLLSIATVW